MVYLREVPKPTDEADFNQAPPERDLSNPQIYQDLSWQLTSRHFENPLLLQTAFTHHSYRREKEHEKPADRHLLDTLEDNKRLEFLGDALLGSIVTQHLYFNYPHLGGTLSGWRAALVRNENLAEVARRLNFYQYLRLSKGMSKSIPQTSKRTLLANTFEAVVAAIYIDQGEQVATDFVDRQIISSLEDVLQDGTWPNAKNRLQEHVHAANGQQPVYQLLEERRVAGYAVFVVGVYVNQQLCGQGQGHSKKEAQRKAAQAALDFYDIQLPTIPDVAVEPNSLAG